MAIRKKRLKESAKIFIGGFITVCILIIVSYKSGYYIGKLAAIAEEMLYK